MTATLDLRALFWRFERLPEADRNLIELLAETVEAAAAENLLVTPRDDRAGELVALLTHWVLTSNPERFLTDANTVAARELLRTEAALMGVPLTGEQEQRANLGPLLDAAHEEVHRLTA